MTKIVYTDQKTFEELTTEVADGSSQQEITKIIGHDDWDYALSIAPAHTPKSEAGKQTEKPNARTAAFVSGVIAAITLLPLLILPTSAEWNSPWPTKWVEINNTGYLVPYFPGKRHVDGECYFIERGDKFLQSEAPDAETGACNEG
ncbi:MAG: hypothetical protein WBB01_15325 [Phormidesmis sp.]